MMSARIDRWARSGLTAAIVALLVVGLLWARVAWKNVDRVWSLTFSPDGRFLAVWSDRAMTIYEPGGAGLLIRVRGGRDAAFTADAHRVAVHSPGTIAIFDLASGRAVSKLDAPEDWNTSIAFSPDGRLLAIMASQMNSLELREVATGAQLWRVRPHEETDHAVAFSPDGRLIATSGSGGNSEIRIWDSERGERLHVIAMSLRSYVHGVRFLADGRSLLVEGFNAIYDISDLEQIEENPQHPITRFSGHVAMSPDGRYAAGEGGASIVWSRTISIIDLASGETLFATGNLHDGLYWGAGFTPDGRSVSIATSNGTVTQWDIASGRRTATFPGNRPPRWTRGRHVLGAAGLAWVLIWAAAYAASSPRSQARRTHRDWVLVPVGGACAAVAIMLLTWIQVADPWRGLDPISALQFLALGEAACLIPLVILTTITHSWRALALVAAVFPLLLLVTAGVWMDAVASV
jgi:WD40 repeat protein